MDSEKQPADNCGSSRCSTALTDEDVKRIKTDAKALSLLRDHNRMTSQDVVHSWMRGETDYPGDGYVIVTMDAYIREHIRQRHYGQDVLASAELDSAAQLIAKLRSYFSL